MAAVEELFAWLLTQLDEDEQVILAAAENYFYADGHGKTVNRWFDRWSPECPDPMLAEVASKRRIVRYAMTTHERAKIWPMSGDGAWFLAVRLLAEAYAAAGRSGYQEIWRP